MIKEEAVSIELPERSLDPLAHTVAERWNSAVQHRSIAKCDNSTLGHVMQQCYEQQNSIIAPEVQGVIEKLGVNINVNLTDLKTSALISWMRDLFSNSGELPFVVDSTPMPELSEKGRLEVLNKVKRKLMLEGFDGDLVELIRTMKAETLKGENEYAQRAAYNMMKLIQDQTVEGDFEDALVKTITDMAIYPFGVFYGPVPTRSVVSEWSKNSLVSKERTIFQFRPLSVWDFFWSPDSRNAQQGTGVCVRERMTKQQLFQCMSMNSYIPEQIERVLARTVSGTQNLKWLSTNPEQPHPFNHSMWGNGDTIEVLRHYGLFSGKELMNYGITGLDERQFYDATVAVIDGLTVQAYVNPNPNLNIRPVYTASYQSAPDSIVGRGIAQKIRDVELAYHQTLRNLMVNSGFAAGPIGEVDYERIAEWMEPEDVGRIEALTTYPVSNETYNQGPAHRFTNVPSNIGAFIQLSEYFERLADRVTQIPASLHGEPVGTGANRTFRGMSMLYGNAIKPIQAAINNMDRNIFKPMGTLMYNYNMRYSDDDSVKGDAKVNAQGSSGLIKREIAKQSASEILQIVGSMGTAAGELVGPNVVQWAFKKVLTSSGVPLEEFDEGVRQAQQAPQMAPEQANQVEQQMPPQTGEI